MKQIDWLHPACLVRGTRLSICDGVKELWKSGALRHRHYHLNNCIERIAAHQHRLRIAYIFGKEALYIHALEGTVRHGRGQDQTNDTK
jgi:hypothetical protein